MESNMTVVSDGSNEVVTKINQKAHSSVSEFFDLDLKQIFHQSGESCWETVVMKSDIVDMHVTGRWEKSILEYYRKKFVFYSHTEDLLPSMIIVLEYTDVLRFRHEIEFLFLAQKYLLLINRKDSNAIFPMDIELWGMDQFKTNVTHKVMEVVISTNDANGYSVKIDTTSAFSRIQDAIFNYVRKVKFS